ncbi:MAG: alkaline phosphatase family protein [Candidatus Aminicenantes bacterium]|nr:MAG: alkaline phosphatase family protein [Candidatus Aminicenantes bacterium]
MKTRVLEIVIDGCGYDTELEIDILESSFEKLHPGLKKEFIQNIYEKVAIENINIPDEVAFILFFNRNPLNIYFEKKHGILEKQGLTRENLENTRKLFDSLKQEEKNQKLIAQVQKVIENTAKEKKYAVWAASTPTLDRLRNTYPSISTKTSGIEIGYEDLHPEVQGNSETGHQQLGNLAVAPQIPLEVSIDIENGRFFENPVLNQSIKTAIDNHVNLNITFMISGEFGNDGRVHSCWNHLESFLKLVFEKHRFDPARLRIQAILDGRDSPLKSSIEKDQKDDSRHGFLYKLKDLLSQYHADDCIAWIIGRGLAMDRDYVEERTKKDYELLVKGKGHIANDFNDAVAAIRELHEKQVFDPFIEPIIIKDKNGTTRTLENKDVLIDLNFRADRQRARIASLLGARQFLQDQAARKGNKWNLDWIQEDLKLEIFCLTEYHPDLEKYGAKIVYPIKSQPHNFLSVFSRYFKQKNIPFKYLLIAESNKATHMGYFIKGRREKNDVEEFEKRFIIPSYAEEHGIRTDDDFFKTPHMKAFEIAGKLLNELCLGIYDLAVVNFSNPDMLGHLITKHFDENVTALEVIDYVVKTIVEFALKQDYYIIVTSDHGNIDEFSASHSLNDVITTFISPQSDIRLKKKPGEKIRLFDIPWAIAEIFNISHQIKDVLPPIPEWIIKKGLAGEVPIKLEEK